VTITLTLISAPVTGFNAVMMLQQQALAASYSYMEDLMAQFMTIISGVGHPLFLLYLEFDRV